VIDGPDPTDKEKGSEELEDTVDEGRAVDATGTHEGRNNCADAGANDVEDEVDQSPVFATVHNGVSVCHSFILIVKINYNPNSAKTNELRIEDTTYVSDSLLNSSSC